MLYTGIPVWGSVSPSWKISPCFAPRTPCSAPNNATRFTPGVPARISILLLRSAPTAEGLVINPMRFPLIRSRLSSTSTSIPGLTRGALKGGSFVFKAYLVRISDKGGVSPIDRSEIIFCVTALSLPKRSTAETATLSSGIRTSSIFVMLFGSVWFR